MDIRPLATIGYNLWSASTITESTGIGMSGSIILEYGWQLISVPVQYGYWNATLHKHIHDGTTIAKFKNYILDQIIDLYGSNKVEVANTYLGSNQFYYNYVVGSTPENSTNNFKLVNVDNTSLEITGFWIKSKSASNMLITWGDQT